MLLSYNHLYFLGVEKRDISCTIGELGDLCSHGRKQYGVLFKKLKIKLLYDPAIHFWEFMLRNGTKGKKKGSLVFLFLEMILEGATH